ncbi:MAG: hypothetical protein AB8V62_01975 [Coxiella endosymbiont of Dermacentor nuttalli]
MIKKYVLHKTSSAKIKMFYIIEVDIKNFGDDQKERSWLFALKNVPGQMKHVI